MVPLTEPGSGRDELEQEGDMEMGTGGRTLGLSALKKLRL